MQANGINGGAGRVPVIHGGHDGGGRNNGVGVVRGLLGRFGHLPAGQLVVVPLLVGLAERLADTVSERLPTGIFNATTALPHVTGQLNSVATDFSRALFLESLADAGANLRDSLILFLNSTDVGDGNAGLSNVSSTGSLVLLLALGVIGLRRGDHV